MFYNGSIYDSHFIIKMLEKYFEGQLECQAHYQPLLIIYQVDFIVINA